MVIGADVMTSIIDYTDRATCVIFGYGAGAVILEPTEDNVGMMDFLHEVDGSGGVRTLHAGRGSLHPASTKRSRRRCTSYIRMGRRCSSSR